MKGIKQEQVLKTFVKPSLYKRFARLADRNQRSTAAELRVAVLGHLERHAKPKPESTFQPDPQGQPGWRFDPSTGERVYSSAWLDTVSQ